MIKMLLTMGKAALAKASLEQKRELLTHAYTLLAAIVRADSEVANVALDAIGAPDDVRDFILVDLWVFDDTD